MTDTTSFDDAAAGRLRQAAGHPFAFCAGEPEYVENHVNGTAVNVCANALAPQSVLAFTDEGLPLAGVYAVGKGQLILVNAAAYPAHPAVRALYERLLERLMREETAAEPVWTETGDDVGSAVYALDDGTRHVYLLAVDWFRPVESLRTAVIRVGENRYTASMPFGVMIKAVAKDGFCAWPHSEDGETLSVEGGIARVQGTGRVTFTLAHGGVQKDVEVDFGSEGVKEIAF